MAITVYGIPNCDTVKRARAWLDRNSFAYEFVDFRATPPDRARVEGWVARFGAAAMRNTSGGSYRALGAAKDHYQESDWIDAYAADSMLIKRPVVEVDGQPAIVGWTLSEDDLVARLRG